MNKTPIKYSLYPFKSCFGPLELISGVLTQLIMGRKSTAQHLIEELTDDDSDEEVYLVAYDF